LVGVASIQVKRRIELKPAYADRHQNKKN